MEAMFAEMDEMGISKVITTGIDIETTVGFRIPNESIASLVKKYSERFVGGAGIDPLKGMRAVREIEHYVREYGFKCVKILPYALGLPPTDRRYYPVFAKCVELDVAVWMQVGHAGPLLPSDPGRPIYLDTVALDFPELRVIGGHIGWPWTEEMIAVAWKHPNIYVDTSAHVPSHYPPEFVRFIKTFGREKVIFGTDYPLLTWRRCVSEIGALGLQGEILENFLFRNAKRAFKLET